MIKTVIFDVDETLVFSQMKLDNSIVWNDPTWGTCYTIERPGVTQTLQKCKDKGYDIIFLTQGVVPFQEVVLDKLGILKYFSGGYGWTSIYRKEVKLPNLQNSSKWVMLDNLHPNEMPTAHKAHWLGTVFTPGVNFIYVFPFYGSNNVPSMLEYYPKIEEILTDD